jgi:hypothetical protein
MKDGLEYENRNSKRVRLLANWGAGENNNPNKSLGNGLIEERVNDRY